MKGAKNIPLRQFFKYTGLLILIIAGGLFGSAISMMQASEILPTFVPVVYDISHILDDRSVFGTFESYFWIQFFSFFITFNLLGNVYDNGNILWEKSIFL